MQITDTVKHLIIINVLFFLVSQLNILPFSSDLLKLHYFQNSGFRWYQLVTHMFMSGGVLHIAFNMFALYSFGSQLEYKWGSAKFLFFYFSCGIGATVFSYCIDYITFNGILNDLVFENFNKSEILSTLYENKYNTQWVDVLGNAKFKNLISCYNSTAVGASGGIFGLLVAFGFYNPNSILSFFFIPINISAKYMIAFLVIYELISGIVEKYVGESVIGHFAHFGGALTGFIIMWFWKNNQFNKNRWN